MKKIDFRSLIIGLLGGVCIFLMMGQNRGTMGDITVDSISVKNGENEIAWIGPSVGGDGFMDIFNSEGNKTIFIGPGEAGGFLRTYNSSGTQTTYLGTAPEGSGKLHTFNQYGKMTTYIGTNKNENGMIVINDKYGDAQWGESGE